MKKTLRAAVLAAGFCLPALAQPIVAELNGRPLQFDQPPVMMGGRVMVPLRGIFESLGANVRFEPATSRITASRGTQSVQLTLGSNQALVDGRAVTLDSPAATVGGRTMVPLRFVSEALGTEVRWQEATQTVFLTSSSAASDAPAPAQPPPSHPKRPPHLTAVSHNARGSLSGGDQLLVSATGDRNGNASFDILGVVENQPMSEVQPGEYRGRFTVPNRLHVSQGTLLVHLRKNGQVSQLEAARAVAFNVGRVGQPGGPGARLDVSRLNLRNGQPVRPVFDLQGQTLPNAQVSVTGTSPRFAGTLQSGAQADGRGRFSVQVNATAIPDNSPLNLTVVARDGSGRQGAPRQVQVVRR
ncbi:copper amine oxidase N-terminal domain-containing protein [bacterium]|nr:copper amine oxidase N-terminal domain-containing protein [bacterium]